MLIVDTANVVGSRPTRWWRDRAGATRSFVEQVRSAVAAGRLDVPVTVVVEGQARAGVDATDATDEPVRLVHAAGSGDDAIVELVAGTDPVAGTDIVVVTADRELADRVRAAGGTVVGPRWLLDRLTG